MRRASTTRPAHGAPPSRGGPHHRIISGVRTFLRQRKASGYIVGGYLRDLCMGAASKDLDLVVEGIKPIEVAMHLHNRYGFSRPVIFRRFNTAFTSGEALDVEVCRLHRDLESDARRRDFTVNCLYADLASWEPSMLSTGILDPTHSAFSDIRLGLLRTPSDHVDTLSSDPLRIMRAIRFYSVLGFEMKADLMESMQRVVYLLSRVSVERLRAEIEKMLGSKRILTSFRLMHRLGVIEMVIPELAQASAFSQATPYHAYDLLTHSIKTAKYLPPDPAMRMAGLLHDLGKMKTQQRKGAKMVYYGHENVSAQMAGIILSRLRFSKKFISRVKFLIGNHMINYSEAWTDRAVRRFVHRMGDNLDDMLLLVEADRRAMGPGSAGEALIKDLRRRIEVLRKKAGVHLKLPISGRDIMEILGVDQGPMVGEAKNFLLDEATRRSRPMARREAVEKLERWAKARRPV
jgi:putative nucleotidyltransferase with HDIG domain